MKISLLVFKFHLSKMARWKIAPPLAMHGVTSIFESPVYEWFTPDCQKKLVRTWYGLGKTMIRRMFLNAPVCTCHCVKWYKAFNEVHFFSCVGKNAVRQIGREDLLALLLAFEFERLNERANKCASKSASPYTRCQWLRRINGTFPIRMLFSTMAEIYYRNHCCLVHCGKMKQFMIRKKY